MEIEEILIIDSEVNELFKSITDSIKLKLINYATNNSYHSFTNELGVLIDNDVDIIFNHDFRWWYDSIQDYIYYNNIHGNN